MWWQTCDNWDKHTITLMGSREVDRTYMYHKDDKSSFVHDIIVMLSVCSVLYRWYYQLIPSLPYACQIMSLISI